jgi:hypothetical protein
LLAGRLNFCLCPHYAYSSAHHDQTLTKHSKAKTYKQYDLH